MKVLTIALASLTGCVAIDSPSPAPEPPTPPAPPSPAPFATDGRYTTHSQLDLTVEAALPEPAYATVQTLRDFSQHPARTLLDRCEAAGVPAVAELRAALPSALESRLEGWIDEQLAKATLDGRPVTQLAAELAALGETTLTQLAITSELELAGPTATHRLLGLTFAPAGADIAIPLADLPAELTTQVATISHDGATLTIGDHRYGISYGSYAWRALETAATTELGATPRALLGQAVSCPAVAEAVASRCVFGVCVGHRAELTELCERGLDEVVAVAQRKFDALRFDALRLAAGTATATDDDGDGVADRLAGGVWTAEIDASQGLRPVPATFTARR